MRDLGCPRCGQRLAFENSRCLHCGAEVGFDPAALAFRERTAERDWCANRGLAQCNWLAEPGRPQCLSCALTRTRPADDDTAALAAFAAAETAKRRLVAELVELGLPIVGRDAEPERGLAFDLLSSRDAGVVTGHADGVITLDLAEGDDVHRERVRVALDEPYRTLLGHFRHEIGHWYYTVLVAPDPGRRRRFAELFGDPDTDYRAALDRHYRDGPPPDWNGRHVSAYATMHPAEDWAETFAHYLHIRDTLDTAAAFGSAPAAGGLSGGADFDTLIALWLPLTWALNMLNRSMGRPDLYPFVLAPPVLDKMRWVHTVVEAGAVGAGS